MGASGSANALDVDRLAGFKIVGTAEARAANLAMRKTRSGMTRTIYGHARLVEGVAAGVSAYRPPQRKTPETSALDGATLTPCPDEKASSPARLNGLHSTS